MAVYVATALPVERRDVNAFAHDIVYTPPGIGTWLWKCEVEILIRKKYRTVHHRFSPAAHIARLWFLLKCRGVVVLQTKKEGW